MVRTRSQLGGAKFNVAVGLALAVLAYVVVSYLPLLIRSRQIVGVMREEAAQSWRRDDDSIKSAILARTDTMLTSNGGNRVIDRTMLSVFRDEKKIHVELNYTVDMQWPLIGKSSQVSFSPRVERQVDLSTPD